MARTTVAEVRVILPAETQLTDAQITAAIMAASCLVDKMVASGCADDISDECLTIIETYVAAHFAAVTEQTLSIASETDPCSGGSVRYGFKFGEGIKGTPFGQMANTLSGGCLADFDKAPVGLYSIGSL